MLQRSIVSITSIDYILKEKTIMELSARNLIPGKVKEVTVGMVNAEVTIEVAPGVEVVSVITKSSVERMGIKVGDEIKAMIKATSVMLAK